MAIDSTELIDSRILIEAIWQNITKLYGEVGASQASLALIDYNTEERTAIIRVARSALEQVRTAIALITRIDNKPLSIHVMAISGTLKALSKKTR